MDIYISEVGGPHVRQDSSQSDAAPISPIPPCVFFGPISGFPILCALCSMMPNQANYFGACSCSATFPLLRNSPNPLRNRTFNAKGDKVDLCVFLSKP